MLQASLLIYAKDEEGHVLLHMHVKCRKSTWRKTGEKKEKCKMREKEKSAAS